jgi:SOS-response transcriptional repressor LexA
MFIGSGDEFQTRKLAKAVERPVIRSRVLGYRATQVLAFIRQQIELHGISPSYAEIMEELGLCSKGDVHRIMVSLEARKLVSRDVNRWGRKGVRVIRLVSH